MARTGLLILMTQICMITDLLYGKIWNVVVFAGAAAGLTLRAAAEGPEGMREALTIAVAVFALLCPLWFLTDGKGIGAGDIKLMAAMGTLMSADSLLMTAAVTFGLAALCGLLRRLAGEKGDLRLAPYAALGALLSAAGLY